MYVSQKKGGILSVQLDTYNITGGETLSGTRGVIRGIAISSKSCSSESSNGSRDSNGSTHIGNVN